MFLGFDLGTTNVKALIVGQDGQTVAVGSAPVDRFCTADGGVEQDIEQIWEAVRVAFRMAAQDLDASRIQAVGISSQGGAMQLLDRHDQPQGRVISWLDGRGQPYDEALTAELGREFFVQRIGHAVSGLAVGQLLRLQDQSPDWIQPPNRIGFVGDVIVGRFCGRRAHDATSLSIAMLYNPRLGTADPELTARLGLREEQLPCLMPAMVAAGTLQQSAAEALGLRPGIPVSPAIHDQYAASLGAGSVGEGDVNFGAGTAWVLLANTGRLAPPVGGEAYVCAHPVKGLFGQMLSMRNGGSAIQWALELLGEQPADGACVEESLDTAPPGCNGLRFWPFLSAGPQLNGLGRHGAFLAGIRLTHGRRHLVRAVVEGLACELRRYIQLLTDAGIALNRLVMCGSAAAGRGTPQIIADITGLPVDCVEASDVSALGAAMIARKLVDSGVSLAEVSRQWTPSRRRVRPGADASAYGELLQEYSDFLQHCTTCDND